MENVRELIAYLEQFISGNRIRRLRDVLDRRTNHLAIVLENIYQSHNASAVLRSCDGFGVQQVHFIENRNTMRINDEVAMGSSSWLTVTRHRETANNTEMALQSLRRQGYRLVVTSPHQRGYLPEKLPLENKTALVFGTEMEGVSDTALQMADDFLYLPMVGFTESFNISVCAAICMYELTRRIRSEVSNWQLSADEKDRLYLDWLRSSIDHSEAIIRDYHSKKKV